MPESPRWLIARGREAEATAVLARCYGEEDEPAAACDVAQRAGGGAGGSSRLRAVVDAVRAEVAEAAEAQSGTSGMTWRALLCASPPAVRRMLVAGVGAAAAQQLTGIEAIQYYVLFLLEVLNTLHAHDISSAAHHVLSWWEDCRARLQALRACTARTEGCPVARRCLFFF